MYLSFGFIQTDKMQRMKEDRHKKYGGERFWTFLFSNEASPEPTSLSPVSRAEFLKCSVLG